MPEERVKLSRGCRRGILSRRHRGLQDMCGAKEHENGRPLTCWCPLASLGAASVSTIFLHPLRFVSGTTQRSPSTDCKRWLGGLPRSRPLGSLLGERPLVLLELTLPVLSIGRRSPRDRQCLSH